MYAFEILCLSPKQGFLKPPLPEKENPLFVVMLGFEPRS